MALICACLAFTPEQQPKPTPGGIAHQEEAGFSSEGGKDRRQGGHRQLLHPGPAPCHPRGNPQEPGEGDEAQQHHSRHIGWATYPTVPAAHSIRQAPHH